MKSRPLLKRRLWVEELESRVVPSVTLSTSTNWSGYAVTTNNLRGSTVNSTIGSVAGSWTVPTVTGSGTSYSADWVGIDGFNSPTVEQIGTDSDISSGVPTYYAWYEMYPQYPVNLSQTVKPGDTISAAVSAGTAGQFTLNISDATEGWSYTAPLSQTILKTADLSSAEWITEAPSSSSGVLPLSDFGTVNFSNAAVTIDTTTTTKTGKTTTTTTSTATTAINSSTAAGVTVNQINMTTNTGVLKDTTSSLTDSGSPATSAFKVTYSPPPPASPPPPSHGRVPFGSFWWESDMPSSSQMTTIPSNQMTTTSGELNGTSLAPVIPFGFIIPGTSNPVWPSFSPPTAPLFSQPSAVAIPSISGAGATTLSPRLAGSGDSTQDFDNGNNGNVNPSALPSIMNPGAPGRLLLPEALPGAFAAPQRSDFESPANLEGAAAVWNRACDTTFMDGALSPDTPEQSAGALMSAAAQDAPMQAATGLMLAFALSSTWNRRVEDEVGRQRRVRLS